MSKEFQGPEHLRDRTIDCEMDDAARTPSHWGLSCLLGPAGSAQLTLRSLGQFGDSSRRAGTIRRTRSRHPLDVMNLRIRRGTIGPVCRPLGPGTTTALLR